MAIAAVLVGFGMPVAVLALETSPAADVAVDANGSVYISSSAGELTRVAAGTDQAEVFGHLDGLAAGDRGPIGITADAQGRIYAAVTSENTTVNGVWRIDASTGETSHIDGSELIGSPSDVGAAADGTLYVTEAESGSIWVLRPDQPAEPWVAGALLGTADGSGADVSVDVRSIAVADDTVYIVGPDAVTVIAIPIETDGSAGAPSDYAQFSDPVGGLAVDDAGGLVVVQAGADRASRVRPDGEIVAIADVDDGLDRPSSVALFDRGDGTATAFVVNAEPSPSDTASTNSSLVAIDYSVSDGTDDPGAASAAAPATVTVEAGDLWFAPSEVSISSDVPTTLVLVGAGQVAHNLTVDELGLQLHVGPGTSSEVTVSELPPGTYQFYCSIYGHRRSGMYGTLTIE